MANKDVLIQALNYEEPARVPWVPYVGVHGGYLIGKDADEYLNSQLLISSAKATNILRTKNEALIQFNTFRMITHPFWHQQIRDP